MKYFQDLLNEQKEVVTELKNKTKAFIEEKIIPNKNIKGALLTGSVARGDARISQFGILIDVAILVENKDDLLHVILFH
jgi:predicted nucleotidyltransferase